MDTSPANEEPKPDVAVAEPELTPKQRKALDAETKRQQVALERMQEEFKDAVYPEKGNPDAVFQLNDATYLRFLRARDYSFPQAKTMFKEHLEFRNKYKPETISLLADKELRDVMEKDGGYWRFAGFSRTGCPVQRVEIGHYSPENFANIDLYIKSVIYENELVRRYFKSTGWKIDKNLFFFDLTDFSYFRHGSPRALSYVKALGHLLLDQYPEQLEYGVLYNAPRLFGLVWVFIRKMLDAKTAEKVKFVYSHEEIQQYISPDQLPEKYGGTMKEDYKLTIE